MLPSRFFARTGGIPFLLSGTLWCAAAFAQPDEPPCDGFCYLAQANKASLVMLVEGGLIPQPLGREIARSVSQHISEQAAAGAQRSSNYLYFEQRLIQLAGAKASRIHTGRSRQDLHETVRRMQLRDATLSSLRELEKVRAALVALAARHVDTVIPAYTHGVQAQPTSLGHYLLAFAAALERDGQRLRQSYRRLNRSPLGAAALGTSGFPLDRERLAKLLGFFGPIENSYDANLVSSVDAKIEFANILALSAVHTGQFVENIHTQYHDPAPWFLLSDEHTTISTIMPQKRNPRLLDHVRSDATAVLGGAQLIALYAHNTNSGMHDYRSTAPTLELAQRAAKMFQGYRRLVKGLHINSERALEELNNDYSTMTEVADTLLREAGVPFRTAHHYASRLTSYGRERRRPPSALEDEELLRIYEESNGATLPVDVALVREAMLPQKMIANRKGLGGPQPQSVRGMLVSQRRSAAAVNQWLDSARGRLANARQTLDAKFAALL